MGRRHTYRLNLSTRGKLPALEMDSMLMRPPESSDLQMLAELMLDAYRGTIDYEGETLEDAVGEVQAYLAGQRGGKALLSESRVCLVDNELVAACLAVNREARQQPLIAYVMTAAAWKNRRIAKRVLTATLESLATSGYPHVQAVVTEGNVPSERLFAGMGFAKSAKSDSKLANLASPGFSPMPVRSGWTSAR